MIKRNDVLISSLSWICRGGVADNYYEPETVSELIELVLSLNKLHESYEIVGFTSNIYFKNTFSVKHLITTKRLYGWNETDDEIVCECGALSSKLARKMVKDGYAGFEGLIDLPGTVGAAIFGNSGCYGCLMSDNLKNVEVLMPDGNIKIFSKEEIHFTNRNSDFKRRIIDGVILRVTLHKVQGDKEKLLALAEANHKNRKETQPGAKYNLGSTYCSLGGKTLYGGLTSKIVAVYSKVLYLLRRHKGHVEKQALRLQLTLVGCHSVAPYLFNIYRFMWIDSNADKEFIRYQKAINRLYKKPLLEIEIKE